MTNKYDLVQAIDEHLESKKSPQKERDYFYNVQVFRGKNNRI